MSHFKRVQEFHRVFEINDKQGPPNLPESTGVPDEDVRRASSSVALSIGSLKTLVSLMQELASKHESVRYLRVGLLAEEMSEYLTAELNDDLVEIADALGDLGVIGEGTCDVYGIPYDDVRMAIHKSNMSKLDENGDPIFRDDGKILKGPKYFPPNIAEVLEMVEL